MSPCPNDTVSFYGLLHGKTGSELSFAPTITDVEALNRLALDARLEVSKVSVGVLPYILDNYMVLKSGSALGRGCGPIVVGRHKADRNEISKTKIAIPGRYTTASLLLRLWLNREIELLPMDFSKIPESVASNEADFGVIIHETRFTYPRFGLVKCQDLGEWWEETTGLPIPLGCVVAKRSLDKGLLQQISNVFNISVSYGLTHVEKAMDFVKSHAQEMEEDVIRQHIQLYVTDETVMLSHTGQKAVNALLLFAAKSGLVNSDFLHKHSIFLDE